MRLLLPSICLALVLAGAAPTRASAAEVDAAAVVATYGDLAAAMYADAHAGARALDTAVDALLADPSPATLEAARAAWVDGRAVYMQTEGFRFGNPVVDAWEGKVNAWPLDEGLIDYVDAGVYGTASDDNPLYTANIIGSTSVRIGRDVIDTTTITPELLAGTLHEAQGVEANVATGWHAIEFLLWGQDLNGTGAGAGNRPASDYTLEGCTGGHCDRRRAYLKAVTDLLVTDMADMVAAWGADGAARRDLAAKTPDEGLAVILTGLGSLSYGELAGERMKLGLILHDPEEEQDCFSDNTHNAHYYDQVGMVAIWRGHYDRPDGSTVSGPGLAALTAARAPVQAAALETAMNASTAALAAIKARAESGVEAYDQMLGEGNAEGNALVQAGVDALVAQARAIESVVAALGLTISVEGSDSLDAPDSVN